jgi:hypothetical protein
VSAAGGYGCLDPSLATGGRALERDLLGAGDDLLDHGGAGGIRTVDDVLGPFGVGDFQKLVGLGQRIHLLDDARSAPDAPLGNRRP